MGVNTPYVIYGVFIGYSWGIHGVFICIGYVSVMYRLCVGYVSEHFARDGVPNSKFVQSTCACADFCVPLHGIWKIARI